MQQHGELPSETSDATKSPKRRATGEKTRLAKRQCGAPPPTPPPPAYLPVNAAARQLAWQNGGAARVIEAMEVTPGCAKMQADGCAALAFLATGEGDYKRRVCAAGGALAAG